MKLHIEKRHLQAFLEAHPRLHALNEQFHFGNNKSQVFYDQLSEAELASLAKLYQQEVEALQQQAALLTATAKFEDFQTWFGASWIRAGKCLN